MNLTKEASDQFEQWKHEEAMEEDQGLKAKPPEGLCYEGFILLISGVKTMKELLDKIDKYDPYNYQIIRAYDWKAIYRGVKIKIQFYKGGKIHIVPADRLKTVYVPSGIVPGRKQMFMVLKDKKSYDNPGGFSDIS